MVVSPNVNEQVTARPIISIGWKRPHLCPLSVSWVFPPLPLLPFHLSLSVSAFVASTAGLRPRQGGKKTDSFHLFKCDLGQTSLPHRREAQRSILYSSVQSTGPIVGPALGKASTVTRAILAETGMLLVWPLLSPGQGSTVHRAGTGQPVPSTSPKIASSFKNILNLSKQQLLFLFLF